MPQRFTTFIRASSLIALAALWILEGSAPVWAQQRQPRSIRAPAQALDAVATRVMPAVSNALLRARHPLPSGIGPLRFAEPLPVGITPATDGTWETLDDGTHLWRLRVRSPDALSLNLGFTTFRMPSGGALFVYAPGYESVVGPFTAKDNAAHGELWTPIVPGDEAIIEVTVPPNKRRALQLTLGQVSHGFRSLDAASAAKRSGACNIDVACDEADPWQAQARAVGRYTVDPGFVCTGALVNNTSGDRTPYFLTANHCGVTPDNAASVVVYWNFQNSFCRTPSEDGGRGDGTLDQFSSGAIHRASTGPNQPRYDSLIQGSDFTLLELDTPVDGSFDAYFAGWNRVDAPTNESVSIHHPQGEEKRISFDFNSSTVSSYLTADTTLAPTHLRVGDWEIGTTEVGSSGSPLFDANQHIVGILSGGFAGCTFNDPTVDNDEPDWFGRLAWSWNSGNTPATRLRDWLDPLGIAPSVRGLNANEDDIVSPGAIRDLQIAESSREGVVLTWTTTGDDGFAGVSSFYDLRYSTSPILSESDFNSATHVETTLVPNPSGAQQTTTVDGLQPNRSYFFAIAAYDNAGNRSPIGTADSEVVLLEANHQLDVYPNPLRQVATVRFAVAEEQHVSVEVYDALGRRVQTVYRRVTSPDRFVYAAVDAHRLSSGRYFIRLIGESFVDSQPVTVVH